MAAFTTARTAPPQAAHPTRPGRPRRGRERLRPATQPVRADPAASSDDAVVIDLARYAAAADGRNTLTPHRPAPPQPTPAGHRTTCSSDTMHPTARPAPTTAAQASLYQQLRGHLAALKLHDAAEHLPAVLDAAAAERPVADRRPGTAARPRGRRHRGPPPGRPAAVRLACPPRPPWRSSTTTPQPGVDPHLIAELATCRYLRIRHQRPADRPARRRQNPPRRRPGPQGRRGRLPHLLHHRRRPRRPLPPRRHRRTLGHHHALLRRPDAAS